jgi:hypothetical protein
MVTNYRLLLTYVGGCNQVVIVDLVPGAYPEHIIHNPIYVKNNSKHALSPSCNVNNITPKKLISTREVKNVFQDGISNFENVSAERNHVTCENCNSIPCNWNRYGPEILSHLKCNYIGLYVDDVSNILDEKMDGATTVMNHHMRY